MGNSPSNKIDRPFENYFSIVFERLSAFISQNNPHTNCFRIFHGFDDSLPAFIKGITIDLYQSIILIQTSQQTETSQETLRYLVENIPKNLPIVYKSRFYENGLFLNKTTVLQGSVAVDPIYIKENNRLFLIQLFDKLDTGLYLDTALVREWLFQNSHQKKILNLYSYTCSYGVAAMMGGALDVVNVDSSRSALQIGKLNYTANNIEINQRSFSHLPVSDFLRFAIKRKDCFETIIIDPSPPPPSLRTIEEKINYYLRPIQKCLKIINPLGRILVSCHNFLDITPEQFKKTIEEKIPEITCEFAIGFPKEFALTQPKMFVFKLKTL